MKLTDKDIIVLNEVDSTNNYAKQLISDKLEDATVVLAYYQNNGKGQQGNYWESEAKKNLLCSLILFPSGLEAARQFLISKVVSLALLKVLSNKVEHVSIKWPNDIYIGTKKIAGILIENTIKGSVIESTIIGVGLNINQEVFVSNAPNPISLFQLTKRYYEVQNVLNEFISSFELLWEELETGGSWDIEKCYYSNLFRRNEWSLYQKDGEEFEARIVGVGDFGQLKLENKSGEIKEFMFKEVEFVL